MAYRRGYSAVEYGSGFGQLGHRPAMAFAEYQAYGDLGQIPSVVSAQLGQVPGPDQYQIIIGTDGLIYLYDPTGVGLSSPDVFSVIGDVASGIYESARGAVGSAVGDILNDPAIGDAVQRAINQTIAQAGSRIYEQIPVEYREPIEREALRQRVTELAQVVPGGFAGIGGGAILLGALALLFFMR